jgi:hypothetical protein
MTGLPREARDGLMRAWLQLLREKHADVTWVSVEQETTAVGGLPAAEAALAGKEFANVA